MTGKPGNSCFKKDYTIGGMIIGIDEVGRGAWAGPMVIGGVGFVEDLKWKIQEKESKGCFWSIEGENWVIGDSKSLSKSDRLKAARWIKENSENAIVEVNSWKIDELGLRKAWEWGVGEVVQRFMIQDSRFMNEMEIVIDGNWVPSTYRYPPASSPLAGGVCVRSQVKGDQKMVEIAAASILAKVYRDELMKSLSLKYPGYGWERNVGYGTSEHREAIKKFGRTKLHRLGWGRV